MTIVLALLSALFFYYGFIAPPQFWRYRVQAGFGIFVFLTLFSAYFDVREARTLGELARLIEPVPDISDVTYIPTPAEIQGIANILAAVPGETRFGTSQSERREFADRAGEIQSRYWKVETELSTDDVSTFYRTAASRGAWAIETDEPPYLALRRGGESLVIFISEDWNTTDVLYIYNGPAE